jgi:hypothetical protein
LFLLLLFIYVIFKMKLGLKKALTNQNDDSSMLLVVFYLIRNKKRHADARLPNKTVGPLDIFKPIVGLKGDYIVTCKGSRIRGEYGLQSLR